MSFEIENYTMDLYYLLKESFKNFLFEYLITGGSLDNMPYLSYVLGVTIIEIPQNTLECITSSGK